MSLDKIGRRGSRAWVEFEQEKIAIDLEGLHLTVEPVVGQEVSLQEVQTNWVTCETLVFWDTVGPSLGRLKFKLPNGRWLTASSRGADPLTPQQILEWMKLHFDIAPPAVFPPA